MEHEMKSLKRNQTWEMVDIPKDSKAIGYRWVYRKKIMSSIRQDWLPRDMLRRMVLTTIDLLSYSQAYIYSDIVSDNSAV